MAWIGRELKDYLFLHPCHDQGQLQLDQGAQSSIQPGLAKGIEKAFVPCAPQVLKTPLF